MLAPSAQRWLTPCPPDPRISLHFLFVPVMLQEEMDAPGMPATVRKVFIIGPDRKTKTILAYPTAGKTFDTDVERPIAGVGPGSRFAA